MMSSPPSITRRAAPRVFLALLLFLTASSFPEPSVILAQDAGNIRVLHQAHQLDFPGGLSFTITVESDSEISLVQLKYGLAGSSVNSYLSGKFVPAKRVTSSFDNLLTGGVYLPPGSTIEYSFFVQDRSGNLMETPTRTLEYGDTRFNWQQVRVRGLTLHYRDIAAPQVQEVARQLDPHLAHLEALLGVTGPQPVRGFIYNTYEEAVPAFPQLSRTITERQVFHGYAFANSSVFLGIGLQPRLIVHESAHLYLSQKLDSGVSHIPSWLDEGFASYAEPGARPRSGRSLSGYPLPLRSMNVVSGGPNRIGRFYLKSESVVAFLIAKHGLPAFHEFLARIAQGSPVETALVQTYGFDLDQLDQDWSRSGSPAGRDPAGRFNPATPFLLFNSWFLGGLFLLVMAVVGVKYLLRKIRPQEEQPPHPWDN